MQVTDTPAFAQAYPLRSPRLCVRSSSEIPHAKPPRVTLNLQTFRLPLLLFSLFSYLFYLFPSSRRLLISEFVIFVIFYQKFFLILEAPCMPMQYRVHEIIIQEDFSCQPSSSKTRTISLTSAMTTFSRQDLRRPEGGLPDSNIIEGTVFPGLPVHAFLWVLRPGPFNLP